MDTLPESIQRDIVTDAATGMLTRGGIDRLSSYLLAHCGWSESMIRERIFCNLDLGESHE